MSKHFFLLENFERRVANVLLPYKNNNIVTKDAPYLQVVEILYNINIPVLVTL